MLPLLAGGFAAAAGGRAAAAFFFALAPGRPWVGITLLRVVVAAITFGFLYWVLRRR